MTNWTLVGSAPVDITAAGEIAEIPVNVNLQLQAFETVGIALTRASGPNFRQQFQASAPPVTNSDITMTLNGYGGAYQASNTPHFMTYYASNAASYNTVWYDAGPSAYTSVNTLAVPNTNLGVTGIVTSYKAFGALLTGPTTITAPAGAEISFSATTGFTTTLQIPTYPDYSNIDVFVRFSNTANVGPTTGKITHAASGSPTREVQLSGNVISMATNVPSLNLGVATIGGPGSPFSYDLTGAGLTGPTNVIAPTGFEVSKQVGGPYAPSVSITALNYVQTVYVRLMGAALGVQSGNVNNTCGTAVLPVAVSGEVLPPYNLLISRHGPEAETNINNNMQGSGLLLLDLSISSFQAPWTVSSITFQGSGTGDIASMLNSLVLYEDSISAGTRDVFDGPTIDLPAAQTGVGFTGSGLTFTATLNNNNFPLTTSRRFFLMGKFAGTAYEGQTLKAEVLSVNASSSGTGAINGVPTFGANPAAIINSGSLNFALNGPNAYTTVSNNSQGPGNMGHVVSDVTISTLNSTWTLLNLTFSEFGTMNAQTGLSYLGLFVDNGNGVWDGGAVDTLATLLPDSGFDAANGTYAAELTTSAGAFQVNQSKRFFLVAKLSGTASPGQTLRVSPSGLIDQAPGGSGEVTGMPLGVSPSLVVDLATLAISAGPANPTTVSIEKGSPFQALVGNFRLTGSVGSFTVNGITLTTSGSGNWANDLDAVAGVQIYLDNGNGAYGSGDIAVFSGPGVQGSMTCNFSSPVAIGSGSHADLWVMVNGLATAGGTPAATFTAEIAAAADVSVMPASANRALGVPAPVTGTLKVVDFSVATFSPQGASNGDAITITGSGFALPVAVFIGGNACYGNPVVNTDGTQITGLRVPNGSGSGLPIVLNTNDLGPKTLTQTFSYSEGGNDSSASNSSCFASPAAPLAALIAPAALALVALRRRRK